MADEIMNAQPGQAGDLGGNAAQLSVNESSQAGVNGQSTDQWAEREKAILAKAYQQAQSLVSKSENRQSNNFQGMIDQFKRDYGVTLTQEQAQEMAQNQAMKSPQNAQAQAQAQSQNANNASDKNYQGFLYYHGVQRDAPYYRQVFDIQNTLGITLDKTDEEYQKLAHPEQKYKPDEFVRAWRKACIDKMMRLQQEQAQNSDGRTNLGQMPLVGSRGNKAPQYDPTRTAKSYFQEYYKEMNKNERK